jgi:quercetin dioxygenase-like cupin family protein
VFEHLGLAVVGAKRTARAVSDPSAALVEAAFHAEGLEPRSWSNGPGDRYTEHSHPYHKVLFCVEGSITFHTGDGDLELRAGDRLDIEPATDHAATVGPEGVTCMEAPLAPSP